MFRFIRDYFIRRQQLAYYDWAWVPRPNYCCSRGKQTDCRYGDYW